VKFPNFLEFEAFNHLREKMGATSLGQFEFFNPKVHLSADEREQLQAGLMVAIDHIKVLVDRTLAFKNGRVLISIQQPIALEDWVFHPAACQQLQALAGEVRASTSQPLHPTGHFQVCADCLQLLRYKGFDAMRNRHRHYSQRLHDEFKLEEFHLDFPPYPLSAKLLHPDAVI
jgi:hypothetical protein